jgi:hypothetical protein
MRIDLSSNRDQEGKDKTLGVGRFAKADGGAPIPPTLSRTCTLIMDEQGDQTIRYETH